jgi:hypothetical protein
MEHGSMSKQTPRRPAVFDLVGRCLVIFGEASRVRYQGIVRGDLGGGLYLVQYFEAVMGEPSTLAVIPVSRMVQPEDYYRAAGAWEFFEDDEHLRYWCQYVHVHDEQPEDDNVGDAGAAPPKVITPSPFVWRDPAQEKPA